MKIMRLTVFMALLCLFLTAQTQDLGQKVYYNDEGPINIAVDAAVASRLIDSPYVMFWLYMGADENVSAQVNRENVILVFNNQEYAMASFDELRDNYDQDRRDLNIYARQGKQSLVTSYLRFYTFQWDLDFCPARFENVTRVDEGGFSSTVGFATKAYFKNPGFKTGDQIAIKVFDKKNREIWGAVAAVL